MTELKNILTQSSHYFTGHILIAASGFISFPLLTRIFSVEDYGKFGLISTTLFIALAVSKFGFPSSIVRFYSEYKNQNQTQIFFLTMLSAPVIFSIILSIIIVTLIYLLQSNSIIGKVPIFFFFLPCLIVTQCINDIIGSFLRAQQKTKLLNLISVISRYGSLTISISLSIWILKGLKGFYSGQIISNIIICTTLMYLYYKEVAYKKKHFSFSLFNTAIIFGLPILLAEVGHLVLNYSDRYLIQYFLGSKSLGIYTAGYTLSTHFTEAIMYPINYAMTPIYMKILVEKGEKQTKEFFTKLFTSFTLIMIPAVFGFLSIGKEIISIMASEKYIDAYNILPYIVLGQAVYSCTIILNSGLFIKKKTILMTYFMTIACVLNIVLNIVLIPIMGYKGAALSTLICCSIYTGLVSIYGLKEFKFKIEYKRIIYYFFASCLMAFIIKEIEISLNYLNVVTKIFSGTIIYSFLILIFDKEIRSKAFQITENWKKKY